MFYPGGLVLTNIMHKSAYLYAFKYKDSVKICYRLGNCMNESNLVFSGYVLCKHCETIQMTIQAHGVCNHCKRRCFDYGVLHDGKFIAYTEIKDQIDKGQKFIDGNHQSRAITHKTFGIDYAVS